MNFDIAKGVELPIYTICLIMQIIDQTGSFHIQNIDVLLLPT